MIEIHHQATEGGISWMMSMIHSTIFHLKEKSDITFAFTDNIQFLGNISFQIFFLVLYCLTWVFPTHAAPMT